MAARVLHFGWDDCYRVQVLQHAGYAVTDEESLQTLDAGLQSGQQVDAVILSEDAQPRTTEQAADIVRSRTLAPVILFRRSTRDLDERKFDQIYSSFVAPAAWLARTAELIAQSKALAEHAARLHLESQAAVQASRRERARGRAARAAARARNKPHF